MPRPCVSAAPPECSTARVGVRVSALQPASDVMGSGSGYSVLPLSVKIYVCGSAVALDNI